MAESLFESNLASLELIARGKVRDILIASTRPAAHRRDGSYVRVRRRAAGSDPRKGAILTSISNFWFKKLESVVPNHLTGTEPRPCCRIPAITAVVKNRAVVVRKLKPVPIEAVVRGYLIIGSGWKDYCKTGRISERGCRRARARAAPASRSSAEHKAAAGHHDRNLDVE